MTGDAHERRAFLTAEWRWLVMLNYAVEPTLLEPLRPRGTTLDLWEGRAMLSVVGFRFLRTRVLGIPIPFHRDFDEVNLRFYVRRVSEDGALRQGVVFVREIVPRPAIAWVARWTFNEPYVTFPMRSDAPPESSESPGTLRYAWRRRTSAGRAWEHVAATATGSAVLPREGSELHFLTVRHWGYTAQRDGGTVEYAVTHPAWRVWTAEAPELGVEVSTLYGSTIAGALSAPPRSALVVDGSAVTVSWPRRIVP